MEIRKLTQKDLNDLIKLYTELTDFENDISKTRPVFEKMLNDKQYYLLGAWDNDRLAGSVLGIICDSAVASGRPFMVVEDVIVSEEYRRKGVGLLLFEKLDEIALKNDCLYSILVSGAARKGAHVFYDKVGYTDEVRGFRKKYF